LGCERQGEEREREGRTVSDAAVIEQCRRMLADYKVPEHVITLTALPENFVGKVEKKKLKAMAVDMTRAGTSPQA
jgi:non-ribosomal peptide synthetase component E (peptide arylation enzyme)